MCSISNRVQNLNPFFFKIYTENIAKEKEIDAYKPTFDGFWQFEWHSQKFHAFLSFACNYCCSF